MASVCDRRRRAVALAAILAFHALVLSLLTTLPPPPSYEPSIFVDLSPILGQELRSTIDDAPSPPADPAKQVRPSADRPTAAPKAKQDKIKTEKPPAPAPSAPKSADAVASGSTPAEISSSTDPSPPQPSSADVLAMVESLTGADVAAVNQPLPPVTTVSAQALNEVRLQELRAMASGSASGCAIDAPLKQGLATDLAVQASLAGIPTTDKSVSNALQIWDGQWTFESAGTATGPLVPIKALVVAVVETAPQRCRDLIVHGPRFLIVPVRGNPDVIIVIGSGEWRWRNLLPDRRPAIFRWFGLDR